MARERNNIFRPTVAGTAIFATSRAADTLTPYLVVSHGGRELSSAGGALSSVNLLHNFGFGGLLSADIVSSLIIGGIGLYSEYAQNQFEKGRRAEFPWRAGFLVTAALSMLGWSNSLHNFAILQSL